MSKLKNAPLVEVIFELRWKVSNKDDLTRCQYLYGDLYSLLKEKYRYRESLVPPDVPADLLINNPIYRFRKRQDGYPLLQVGPGIISLNTVDEYYDWEEYFVWCKGLMEALFDVYPHNNGEMFTPTLLYIDFLKTETLNVDILNFVNTYLNININQGFYKTEKHPEALNWAVAYKTELGQLGVTLNTGKINKVEEGIILQTKLNGTDFNPDVGNINSWLTEAHEFCSQLFKDMTKGPLYQSFNQ